MERDFSATSASRNQASRSIKTCCASMALTAVKMTRQQTEKQYAMNSAHNQQHPDSQNAEIMQA
jgi:hypothetical protein